MRSHLAGTGAGVHGPAHDHQVVRLPRIPAGRLVTRPAIYLAAVLAVAAGLLALIDTHRERPEWDDYRDALKERL